MSEQLRKDTRYSRYDCALWGTGWASGPACEQCVRRDRRGHGRFGLLWVLWYRIFPGVAV